MAQFLSGRRTNFNVGISSVTENTTSLQVIGNVGIGTTNADGRSLYVIGNSEVSGILTASRIYGEFTGGSISGTNIVGTALSISGISTLSALGVTGLTTTKDLQVTGISSLNAISAGGTTGISQYVLTSTGTGLIWQSLTASSGVTGINVAEDFTSGLKYLAMQTGAGTTQTTNISSNQLVYSSTTKNLGIGTANPTSKLTVQGDGKFTGVVTATTFIGNLTGYASTSGIATYATNAGIATYATSAGIATYAPNAGISTNIKGGTGGSIPYQTATDTTALLANGSAGNLLQSNGGTLAPSWASPQGLTIGYANTAGIATYAPNSGIATYATNAGIATYATNAGIATYATSAGIATYATNAGIATNIKGGAGGSIPYQTAIDTTALLANGSAGNLLQSNGTTLAPSWASPQGLTIGYANTAGIATYAPNSGIATYAPNAGIATYAPNSGIATYAPNAGIATYAPNAGIATYAPNAGIATYATNAGIATYAPNAGIATYAPNSGIATYAPNAGIATYAPNSGIATYATNAGIATYAPNAGIATYATLAGIATYATNAGIATYATNAGIATYATSAGIATYATNAGIATNIKGGAGGSIPYQTAIDTTALLANGSAGNLLQSNGTTLAPSWASPQGLTIGYANTAGIATYATNAGIATSVIGGIASVTSLFVNTLGISTLGTVKISSGIVTATTGVVTYYGDGSNLTNLPTSIPVDTIAVNAARSITFIPTGVATTSRIGVNLNYLSFIPSNGGLLGINTNNPQFNLHVFGNGKFVGNVTADNFYGTASYATTSGIATYATNIKGGTGGSIPYQTATDTTALLANGSAGNLLQSNGTTLAPSWASPQGLTIGYANTAGIATYATNAGIATYATNSGIATYATNSGIATYATNAGIATYATSAGIATYAPNSGIATYAPNAGIATYAPNAGIATYAPNAGIATYAPNAGIATYAPNAGIATNIKGGAGGSIPYQTATDTTALLANGSAGNLLQSNGTTLAPSWASPQGLTIGYANTAGISSEAVKLKIPRTISLTGDVAGSVSFDGSGDVSIASTIQLNSVALGSDTTGDYVQSITGTENQISVSATSGEGSTPTLSIPNQFTAPQDVTVSRDLQVNRNLNVNGNITIGGTNAFINVQQLRVSDPDLVLGFRTDAFGNDVSNDTTANHGGIAIASTEGNPLVQLYIAGIETTPATYKKIMWFKAGSFAGLNTDAWLSNYAVGIGSTQFPAGTRLAAGSVQFTENDLAVVRNINSSGIITATKFVGALDNTSALAQNVGFATTASNLAGGSKGLLPYQYSAGITTFLSAAGTNNQVLLYDTGSNTPYWGNVSAGSGSFGGITVKDEGGTSYSSIITLDIYGSNITATSGGTGIASIRVSDNLVGTALSISGISTLGTVQISSGIVTSTTGTAITFVGNLTGTASTASFATTAYSLNGVVSSDLKVAYATTAGIATNLGSGSTGSLPYQYSTGITSFLSAAGTNNQVLLYDTGTNKPYWGNVSSGISSVSISTNTTNQSQYLTYVTGTGSTTGFGVTTTGLVFNPSTTRLGIGTTSPRATLHVRNDLLVSTGTTASYDIAIKATTSDSGTLSFEDPDSTKQYFSINKDTNTLFAINKSNFEPAFIVNSSGFVGIGTTNPQSTLQVGAAITMYGPTGIVSATKYYGDGSNLTGTIPNAIANIDVNQIYYPLLSPSISGTISSIGVSSSSIVFNPGPNYLGIGTTNPSTNLHVQGNVRVSGASTLGPVQIYSSGNTGIVTASSGITTLFYYGDGSGLTKINAVASAGGNTGQVQFNNAGAISGASYFNYDSTNVRVGIGTSVPTARLSVASPTSGNSLLLVNDNLSDGSLFRVSNSAGNLLVDVDSGGTILFPTSGNIGIGSTLSTPTTKLHIDGDVTARYYYGDGRNLTNLGLGGIGIATQASSATPVYLTLASSTTTTGVSTVGIATTGLSFITSTNTLQVGSGITMNGSTGIISATSYYGDGSNLKNVSASPGGNTGQVQFNNGTAISGAPYFNYDSTNVRVGIGTSVPTARLSVASPTSGNSLLLVNDNLSDGSLFRVSNSAGSLLVDVDSGGTILFPTSGNIGIGSTLSTPTTKLHVDGDVRITRALYDSNNSTGSSSQVLQSVGTGISWVTFSGAGSVSISTNTTNQTQYLTYVTGTGSTTGFGITTSGLVFNPSTGNLGIGTTNPLYRFSVTGSGAVSTPSLTNVVGDFTANTNSFSQINTRNASNGANASSDIIATADTGTDVTNYIDLGINNSGYSAVGWTINGALDGYLYTSDTNLSIGAAGASKYVSVFTGGTLAANERLRVTGIGSVGIGTTNPSQTLHVQGNARISGALYDSNNNVGTAGSILSSTGSSISWIAAASGGGTVSISTNTTNQAQYLTYVTTTGTATTFGVTTSGLVFNPGTNSLGIGTTNPSYNLHVNGSFGATTKSFIINHPTKEGKKLQYGSLESPYHGIRLTGSSTIKTGKCVVELPDYIHTFVKEEGINIHITNIKHGKVLWVDEVDVANNRFIIMTEETSGEYDFYWDFTAIRKDIEDLIVEF